MDRFMFSTLCLQNSSSEREKYMYTERLSQCAPVDPWHWHTRTCQITTRRL